MLIVYERMQFVYSTTLTPARVRCTLLLAAQAPRSRWSLGRARISCWNARPRRPRPNPVAVTPRPSALPLDMRHVTHYTALVIKTFADRHASELFVAGRSSRLPADIVRRARRKLEYIDLASCLEDLHVPPGNRLHKLAGDREGQYAIAINDRWRICFRFVDGDALDVEITDYH